MKGLYVFLALICVISGLVWMIIYAGKISDHQSSIFMHPSNFDKPPIEVVSELRKDHEDNSDKILYIDELKKQQGEK